MDGLCLVWIEIRDETERPHTMDGFQPQQSRLNFARDLYQRLPSPLLPFSRGMHF